MPDERRTRRANVRVETGPAPQKEARADEPRGATAFDAPTGTQAADAQEVATAPAPPKEKGPGPLQRLVAWVRATFPGHEKAFVGGVVGFVLALMVLIVGFWPTLLIVVFVVAGIAVGQLFEGDPKISASIRTWIEDRRR